MITFKEVKKLSYNAFKELMADGCYQYERIDGVTVKGVRSSDFYDSLQSYLRDQISEIRRTTINKGKPTVSFSPGWYPGRIQNKDEPLRMRDVIDLYAPMVLPSGAIPLGSATLEEGIHRLTFTSVGKSNASLGYRFGIDSIELRR